MIQKIVIVVAKYRKLIRIIRTVRKKEYFIANVEYLNSKLYLNGVIHDLSTISHTRDLTFSQNLSELKLDFWSCD